MSDARAAARASARARIFFKRFKLSSSPRFPWSVLTGIAFLIPAGRPGAIPLRAPPGSANFTARGTGLSPLRRGRPAARLLRRSGAQVPSPVGGRPARPPWVGPLGPQHPLQDWRPQINPYRDWPSGPGSAEGRPLGAETTSLLVVVGLLDRRTAAEEGLRCPVPLEESFGDTGRLNGRAPRAGALAAARGVRRHRGRARAPCVLTRAAALLEEQSASLLPPPPQSPDLRRLSEKGEKRGASRGPGGCAPRRLSGCAASRG